ncbi:MAG: cupin domain-containing protein [Chloroflexi bacterium]|nr:cupin domain-containing protein [Chloroflexota bacterium]
MAVQEPSQESTPVRTMPPAPILRIGELMGRLNELIARNGAPPWVEPLVMTDDIHAWVICHPPGQPNDTHYHLHDEWWVVLAGEIEWWIEGEDEPIRAKAGDFVFGPKGRWHHIEPVGSESTIRLGIKEPSEFHRYDRPGCRSKPWRLKPGETPSTAAPQD